MTRFYLILGFILPLFILSSEAKTVHGVFNSYSAQAGKGQYVTSFAFHGN